MASSGMYTQSFTANYTKPKHLINDPEYLCVHCQNSIFATCPTLIKRKNDKTKTNISAIIFILTLNYNY